MKPALLTPCLLGVVVSLWLLAPLARLSASEPQYSHRDISIPAASADEPGASFSLPKALNYLEQGARAWSKEKKCVSCHTNGSYLLTRPALTKIAGPPSTEIHRFFVDELLEFEGQDIEGLRKGITPTQVAYLAAGLAETDFHVYQRLSPETDRALRLMFALQSENGAFSNDDGWPPLESSEYHGAVIAVMAASVAPGWLESIADKALIEGFRKATAFLRDTRPPHDYARLLLLWASIRTPGLIDNQRKDQIVKMLWRRQGEDGGWSIRNFASPEAWGRGNRAAKLRAEPDFEQPQSDGHQTGLVTLVLREAGTPADDPRIQRAVAWLLRNQRESGRWWTRSLNTDKFHFITYSGTCYALLALDKCGALPDGGLSLN